MTQDTQESYDDSDAPAPRNNQLARRDFSGTSLTVGSAASEALVAKARADTEARWIMAMRRPRNLDDVRQSMLKECRRPGFADAAVYEIPRGGNKIVGLSIRFAEVAVRCMGNLQPEVVTIYDDDEQRIVRCTVTDYESNVTWSKDLTVRKSVERKQLARGQRPLGERVNSYGDKVFLVPATDDDVNTKEAALVSKALRTLILRCIPGHLQDECLAVCNRVYADKAAKDPDGERVKVLDSFAQIGVMPSEIEELIGHTTERMSPAELDRLRKLFAAISEGHTSIAEALEVAAAERAKTPATAAPAAPQATNAPPGVSYTPPATAAPQATPAPKATRGTAALKNKLDKATEDARARDAARAASEQPAKPAGDPETEPGWMAGRDPSWTVHALIKSQWPEGTEPPADGYEYRSCRGCGVPIEVKVTEQPGGQCYACSQA